jgi:membrane-bound serine protease (ClpP class)
MRHPELRFLGGATATRLGWPLSLVWFLLIALVCISPGRAGAAGKAAVLEINGAIGPATADYIVREIRAAKDRGFDLIILRMDTPGGLDASMREIITQILASPVPVVTYVAPSGARAASAGTYIAYASSVAAMAPSTNIGAATPVSLGGPPLLPGSGPDQNPGGQTKDAKSGSEPQDAETRKVVNDAVAYIRGLAEFNHRNADWAADAVRNASSLSASDALKLNVVDVIAEDAQDLLRKIDGRDVVVAGKPFRLTTAGLTLVDAPPDWRTELLAALTNPNIAFLLMLIGVYGLILEFWNPGAVAPGLIGSICLIAALYGLNLLPVNYAGAALVLLGLGLMIAEVHIGAFGAIGVGGVVAFVLGALMMFPSELPGFRLSPLLIGLAALFSAGFILIVLAALLRSRRRAIVTGGEALLGAEGEVVSWNRTEGRVRVAGEMWRAQASTAIVPGARIQIIGREGLMLRVKPL